MERVGTRAEIPLVLEGARRPARFASVVLEELAHRIIGGTFPEGTVLPTEPVLCEQFGFSRTVIREGLKQLEERGLVRVEQGRGTTAQPRDSWNLLDPTVIRIALAYDSDMLILSFATGTQLFVEPEIVQHASFGLVPDTWSANQLAYQLAFRYGDFNAAAAIAVDLLLIGLVGAVLIVTRSGLFRSED